MLCSVHLLPKHASAQKGQNLSMHIAGLVDHHSEKLLSELLIELDPLADVIFDVQNKEVTMRATRPIALNEINSLLVRNGFSASGLTVLGDQSGKPDHQVTEADVRSVLDLPTGHAIDAAEYDRLKNAWIANDPAGYRKALEYTRHPSPNTDEE
jgi:hypothetical protein